MLRNELANKKPYQASMKELCLRLLELQVEDKKAWQIRKQSLKESWKEIDGLLHYQSFLFIPKVICTKLISQHHNNFLTSEFGIEKAQELIAQKYYWLILQADVESHVQACNMCLTSNAICHQSYGDL